MGRYQSRFMSFAENLNRANSRSSCLVQAGLAHWQKRNKGKKHSW